ncbi:MAG: LysM peptidoglycan-binding domain-containing protein, partial [Nitrospinaceae bacterium]
QRKVAPIRRKYKRILRRLAKRPPSKQLSKEERRVANLVKGSYSRAARKIRVQLGQMDRFKDGLIRSGRYMKGIEEVFRKNGVPKELTILPHVESSFQVNAYSVVGAAGVWQFTRRTGRRYMEIGYEVDERRDPILSADAAAKLLKHNYQMLESWPLAITAYNHGVNGMKRAKKKFGADIVKIVKKYKKRTFGFASRNFYAEFLAALNVVREHDKYFPNIKFEPYMEMVSIPLPYYFHIDDLARHMGMTRKQIAKHNLALRKPVISGKRRIPKGFIFQMPAEGYADIEKLIAQMPVPLKHSYQLRARMYTVRRGDNLITIARRLGTTVQALKAANNIYNKHRIYRGQVLELPVHSKPSGKPDKGIRSSRVAQNKTYSPDDLTKYKVRRHDNVSKIAQRFEMTVPDLIRVNRLRNPNRLYPGQTLQVARNLEVSSGKSATGKLALKAKQPLPSDSPTPAAVAPPHGGKGKITIAFAEKISLAKPFNKNRPAFLPIRFDSTLHKNGKVGIIVVDFEETVSQLAEWAKLSVNELRRFNNLGRKSQIKTHQTLRVPFYNSAPRSFEEKRQEFHKSIQEDFFNNFRVEKVVVRNLKRGETLWEICNDHYVIPMWLLSNYNPNKDLNSMDAGEPIIIPLISAVKA